MYYHRCQSVCQQKQPMCLQDHVVAGRRSCSVVSSAGRRSLDRPSHQKACLRHRCCSWCATAQTLLSLFRYVCDHIYYNCLALQLPYQTESLNLLGHQPSATREFCRPRLLVSYSICPERRGEHHRTSAKVVVSRQETQKMWMAS